MFCENVTNSNRNKLIELIPDHEKSEFISKASSNKKDSNAFEYYTSSSFDNILKSSVVERIRELEERETILEKNYKQREIILNERIKLASEQASELDEKIKIKQDDVSV